jgi:hypothetical protein
MWLVLLLVAVIAVILVFVLTRQRRPKEEIPLYVCPECGNHHCNCYLKEKVDENPGGEKQ